MKVEQRKNRTGSDGMSEDHSDRQPRSPLGLVVGLVVLAAAVALAFYAGRVDAACADCVSPATGLQAGHVAVTLQVLVVLGLVAMIARVRKRRRRLAATTPVNAGLMVSQSDPDQPHQSRTEPDDHRADRKDPTEFRDVLVRHWQNCRKQSSFLGLIIVHIDNFPGIVDAIGHPQANQYLEQAGRSLDSLVLSKGGRLFPRPPLGDSHFAVLLPNTSPDEALQVAEDIRLSVEDLDQLVPAPEARVMTACAGLAITVPDRIHGPDILVTEAAGALSRAQEQGRGRVAVELVDEP